MGVYRYEENPILTPADVTSCTPGFRVVGVFNAGVARLDNQVILLLRVAESPISDNPDCIYAPVFDWESRQVDVKSFRRTDSAYNFTDSRIISPRDKPGTFVYLTSYSYFRIARSRDGRHFTVDDKPFMLPSTELESFGIEDPRICKIDGTFCITYSMVSPAGVGIGLATTQDFRQVTRHGMIFAPENKDVAFFPEMINGKYYALHRPIPKSTGSPEVWVAESSDLIHWGNHRRLFGVRSYAWDNERVGAGVPPIRTSRGWLELYHGANQDSRYCMGAILLDLNFPNRVIARGEKPLLEPIWPYECEGFFGNVVFSCGALVEGDVVRMYYGAADTSMACAELSLTEILSMLN